MRKVVVTGLGLVSPVGPDVATSWDRLRNGQSGIGPIQRFDASDTTSKIAGEVDGLDMDAHIPKKEQRRMDRFSQYAIIVARQAMQDSGLDMGAEDPSRCGVVVGSGVGGLQTLADQHQVLMERGPSRCSPFMIPSMIVNMAGGLIAIEHNLQGANYSVVSACASAAHSMGDAMRMIQHGAADVMLAGGAEACVTKLGVAGFCSMKALSTRNDEPQRASRPFDAERDGFVMGEGAAILVLEELEHARKRGAKIYCELAGFGMTCDAFHMTAPAEDARGASRSMRNAVDDAGLSPEDVDYINAHGTSTNLNDKIETLAIKKSLGEDVARKIMISSTKSMTGHLLGAAGGLESVVCALAIQDGIVPPTINQETSDPDCDLDYVPNEAREADVKVCLNNSLGFGGHNATLCFKKMD